MNWVSVKSWLPTDLKDMCKKEAVLVYSEESGPGRHGIARYINGKWEVLGDEGAHSCTGFYHMDSSDITHWKRLDCPDEEAVLGEESNIPCIFRHRQ